MRFEPLTSWFKEHFLTLNARFYHKGHLGQPDRLTVTLQHLGEINNGSRRSVESCHVHEETKSLCQSAP